MFKATTPAGRRWRSTPAFRMAALAAGLLIVLVSIDLSADRRQSGGSVRQSSGNSNAAGKRFALPPARWNWALTWAMSIASFSTSRRRA